MQLWSKIKKISFNFLAFMGIMYYNKKRYFLKGEIMTKIKNIAIKFSLCLLLILTFFIAQNSLLFSQFSFASPVQTVSAVNNSSSSDLETSYSSISNYNFATTSTGAVASTSGTLPSNYTGNTSILTPSSWTKNGTANKSMSIGVIDVSPTSFATNFDNYSLLASASPYRSSMSSDTNTKILMINSTTATTYGYTSSSFTLEANSYYSITVDYYTGNTDAIPSLASVCLIGDDFDGLTSTAVLGVQTNKNWGTITFWIATNEANSSTAKIGLYLGCPAWTNSSTSLSSSGYVFFDNVELTQYSENYFTSQDKDKDNYSSYATNQFVDLTYGDITSGNNGYVEDGGFNTTTSLTSSSSAWTTIVDDASTITGASTVSIVNANTSYSSIDVPYTNARTSDNKVLMVYNAINRSGKSSGTVTSKAITIKQHNVYRISFWAKTNADSITATLAPTGTVNGNTYEAVSISTASTDTSVTTNDWNEYVFFVTGNSLTDASVTLTLGLSSSNNTELEYAFFDDVTSQLVSSEDRDNASDTGITYKTLDLNPSSSLTIANGYFNLASSTDREVTYPLEVSGWTYGGITNSTNAHGIVNLKSTIFNEYKSNFNDPSNPAKDSGVASNNVLMLYNNSKTTQSYTTTSSFSASATTTYKLTVDICTQVSSTNNGGANIYITNSNGVTIAEFLDINTNGLWETYTLYFKNYGASQSLNVTLGFGRDATNKTVSGWAYFDNCVCNTYSGTTDIADITTSSTVKVINLAKTEDDDTYYYSDSFSEYDTDQDTLTHLYDPFYWETEVKAEETDDEGNATTLSDEDITSGIVNASNIDEALSIVANNADMNRDFLLIRSLSDTYYTATNKFTVSLSASSYYKISVWVKTVGLTQDSDNTQYEDSDEDGEEDDAIPYGASISIDGIDDSFTGINTNGSFDENENGWVEYIFYINTTDAIDMQLYLGLGSEDAWTSGYAFFDDITVLSMTEDAYTLALNIDLEATPEQVVSVVNTTADEDEDEDSSSSTYDESLAWLAIPTIILAVAVIVALAGYGIKKYLEKRPVKVKVTNNYDRSATLLKDLDHRNYKASVHHRLKLLYEELKQTEQYLEDEQIEHKKQMEAYQTAKEIAQQDKSIQLETPNKKYMDFDKTVEQLKNNIASIKTDIELLEEEQRQIIEQEQRKHKEDLKGNKITRRK